MIRRLLVFAMTLTPLLAGEPPPAWRAARITYLTRASIYVDAGLEDGIDPGQELQVVRGGELIATVTVTDLSPHRAVCVRQTGTVELAVGDTVRFVPRSTPPPQQVPSEAAGAEPPPAAVDPGPAGGSGLHGRVGVRYLAVRSKDLDETGFSQPALDLRLEGESLGGAPIDLAVDVRSRTTRQTRADVPAETDNLTSVYRLAAAWHRAGSPWRVTAGRTVSPSLAVIDIFDGVEVQYSGRRWTSGLFTGTQPDAEDLGYSSDVKEHGGYVGIHGDSPTGRRWEVIGGLVGSYQESEINREFAYLQGRYSDPRLSIWLAEEADLNRGWKEDAEGESVSLSSTYLNLRFRPSERWALFAGYDNRRNVRLYRDKVTPLTQFDDEHRQGAWTGFDCRIGGHFRAGVDVRFLSGGDEGGADGYTLRLAADRLTRANLSFQTRSTWYSNDRVEGWLHSLSAGVAAGSRWYIELLGGVQDQTYMVPVESDATLTWYGLGVDLNLGRNWFASLAAETSQGADDAVDQVYSSVTVRF